MPMFVFQWQYDKNKLQPFSSNEIYAKMGNSSTAIKAFHIQTHTSDLGWWKVFSTVICSHFPGEIFPGVIVVRFDDDSDSFSRSFFSAIISLNFHSQTFGYFNATYRGIFQKCVECMSWPLEGSFRWWFFPCNNSFQVSSQVRFSFVWIDFLANQRSIETLYGANGVYIMDLC